MFVACALPSGAQAVPGGGIELVDRPSGLAPLPFDGVNSSDTVGPRTMSSDGCFVVFESSNDVLGGADDDAQINVYRANRCAAGNPVDLVSATATGVPGDRASGGATISSNGRFVAFDTRARNLLPAGTTVPAAVVRKDMLTGAIDVMSRSTGDTGAVVESHSGVIASGGTAVAFVSNDSVDGANADTTAGDYENRLYVRFNNPPRTTHLVSAKADLTPARSTSEYDLAADGRSVILATHEALLAGDTDGGDADAYVVRGLSTGGVSIDLVSGSQRVGHVAIADDAQRVAFGLTRVYAAGCSPACGSPFLIDGTPPPGPFENTDLGFPRGSHDEVFWRTSAPLLSADADADADVYLRDITNAWLSLVGGGAAGRMGPADVIPAEVDVDPGPGVVPARIPHISVFSIAGPTLAGNDGVRRQLMVFTGGVLSALSVPGEPRTGEVESAQLSTNAVSAGGRHVVFSTYSSGLGAVRNSTGWWTGALLMRDLVGRTTTRVDITPAGGPADETAQDPSVDASGSRVVFESSATNLVPTVVDGRQHIYLRDLATGTTRLLDRGQDGQPADLGAARPVISSDGNKVGFASNAANLPGSDGYTHVYLADVASGSVTRVDATSGGLPANGPAYEVALDGDGSHVAFTSAAPNLGPPGATEKNSRLYVRDLATGAVTWASISESGDPGGQSPREVSLSDDARRVAFGESNPNFGYGARENHQQVFVRDLQAGITTLASAGGAGTADAYQYDGELDANGSHLAFVEGNDNDNMTVFVRDLIAGTTTRVASGESASFDTTGRCVALASAAQGLPGDYRSPDFSHVYLAAVGDDCPVLPGVPAGGGGPPGGASGADSTAPVLSDLRMTRRRFRVGTDATAISAAGRGSVFTFALSEDARTSIAIARQRPGRRAGSRCVKSTRKNRARKRCTYFVVLGTITRAQTKRGANRVAFSGRLGKRKLPFGSYRATLAAVDAAGNRSAPRRVSFRLVRR